MQLVIVGIWNSRYLSKKSQSARDTDTVGEQKGRGF